MITIIPRLRREKGYTQEELAKLIDVSRPYFSAIEKGEKELTIGQARSLAEYFGISLEDFIANRIPAEPQLVIKKDKKKAASASEMRISVPEENIRKFKEVLLYVLSCVGARPNVGESVLCKLLYFIDFDFYEKYERQLMGAVYIKNHHGPTPAGFPQIIKTMEDKGELVRIKKQFYSFQQTKYLPVREPDLSLITAEEKAHIDLVLAKLSSKNAREIEEYSHRDVPWISAADQSVIDYESVFYRTPDFSVRSYD